MQNMRTRLTLGAAWLAATRVLVNLTAFFSTLLLARLLVPADFGLVAIATTLTTVIASVTELSLSSALIHHKGPTDDHFHTAFTLNFARAAGITAIILLIAVPASRLYGDPRLIGIMMVTGGATLLSGATNPKLAVFSRQLIFWQDFVIGVSQKLTGFVVSAAVALIWHSYWALIAGNLATQIVTLCVSYLLIPYRPRLRVSEHRELLSFSIWLSLGQAINTLNFRADHLAIGFALNSTALGYYTVGDNLAVLPTREATTPLAQTLFPGFAQLTGDPDRLRRAYQRAQAFLCAVALPLGCGFAMIAKPLILLAMGAKWVAVIPIIQLLASIFAIQTLASTLQPLAMAMGDTRGLFNRDVVNLIMRLPLIGIGMWSGGLIGIVYARCVSGLASTVINMLMVRRLLDLSLRQQLAVNTRPLLAVLAMAGGMYLLDRAMGPGATITLVVGRLVVLVATGGLIYVTGLFLLWRQARYPGGPESEVLEILARVLPATRAWMPARHPSS